MKTRVSLKFFFNDSRFSYNRNILCLVSSRARFQPRPWHDARAIARARAITRANQEKGSLGGR